MASIGLRFETCITRVTSADADDLVWLAAFLECGFEAVDPSSTTHQVVLTVDPVAHDALLARGPAETDADVEGFAKDSNPSSLQRWSSNAETVIVRDGRLPGFYRLPGSRRAVEILVREKSRRCRTTLMRAVRELTMDRIVATGGVLVHGAAVRSTDGVIVISGPKQRGKTTLLMALMAHTPVAYVSNDRCVLRVDGDSATVRGLPTIVSIRRNGLDAFPDFRDRLFAARPELTVPVKPNVSLGPHELVDLLSSRRASSGPAVAFLFPRVTSNPERIVLRRLSRAEALACFREGLFRAGHASVVGEAFASPSTRGQPPWPAAAHAGRWVAETLPCFEATLGGGQPPTAEECQSLLAHVAGG